MNKNMNDLEDAFSPEFLLAFRNQLADWYQINKRTLPWRETGNPYFIWISEIILQQTRVVQGMDYYMRFIKRFPTVASLAEVEEEEVLKYWQGLGYYSRARNLYASACRIMDCFQGIFPKEYANVLSLKGVGEYTAAAICSFAYNAPFAVVDGNVFRFLSRLFGIEIPIDSTEGKKYFYELAQTLLDKRNSSLHNQAMMEMGAMQCLPLSPDCTTCPFLPQCFAYNNNRITAFPVKQHKTKVGNRYFSYFYLSQGEYTYINKRTQKDVWQNLYEFPLIETDHEITRDDLSEIESVNQWIKASGDLLQTAEFTINHVLSHRIIHASFYEIILDSGFKMNEYQKIEKIKLKEYPVSRLIQLYLEKRHSDLLSDNPSLFEKRM